MTWQDDAQDIEMLERNSILEAKRKEIEQESRYGLSHCEDCGDPIDNRRRATGGKKKCVLCQEYFEKQQKRGLY